MQYLEQHTFFWPTTEAEELIKNSAPDTPESQAQDLIGQMGQARQLLDTVAEKGDLASTHRLLDAILSSKILPPSSALYGPLIKAYVVRWVWRFLHIMNLYF